MYTRLQIVSGILFLMLSCSFSNILAQKTPAKDQNGLFKNSPFLDASEAIKPLDFQLIDTVKGNSILNFKTQRSYLGFKSNVNNYFDPFDLNKKKVPNFMGANKETDDDILIKRHFNGKDMSRFKIESDFSLGTLETKSKLVKIEVRDHSLVDGDRIKVYLNEKVIHSNIMLNGVSYSINIELKSGYNRIDIEALNEGYSGPNTAELRVFDENGYLLSERDWNISTGNFATLGIIKN